MYTAARGAVRAAGGGVELAPGVMDGRNRAGGAVAGVRTVRNPILLARAVMERTPHVLLIGAGAERLAAEVGLERVDPSFFRTAEREEQLARTRKEQQQKPDVYGTVGAVVRDAAGHVAAATSTGGTANKLPGRVGDTPVLGAGTFAWDRTCAVSGTGHGEPFIRLGVAARVSALMELAGLSVAEAVRRVVHRDLPEIEGEGGVVAVDAAGEVALAFNTAGMFRGWLRDGGAPHVEIW
jgi:beta-aspartyl-peptidase (threonine type)